MRICKENTEDEDEKERGVEWTCDAIPKMARDFCFLFVYGADADADGAAAVVVVVSVDAFDMTLKTHIMC